MERNEMLEAIISALIEQGIEENEIRKLLYEEAKAVMIKKNLCNYDLIGKTDDSRTNTSAITLTTKAMNIFLDEEIVYAQAPHVHNHIIRIDVELFNKNMQYLKRGFEGDFNIGTDEKIEVTAHIGIHAKESQKNQLYIGRKVQDSYVFNLFRSLLLLNDSLAIVRLKNNRYAFFGFTSEQLPELNKITYIEMQVEEYYEEKELIEENSSMLYVGDEVRTIDIASYENASLDIDMTKECFVDLNKSNNLREIRKNQHSRLIAYFGKYLQNLYGYLPEENSSVDLMFEKNAESVVICEIKTLNGTTMDERSQVLHAFAQLYYYRMYRLGKYRTKEKVHMIAVFNKKISQKYINFFEKNKIFVMWYEMDEFTGTDNAKRILS